MAFTTATAREAGRKGGRSTLARYGSDHFRQLGRKGFDGLARKLGFMGGSRRVVLFRLIREGKVKDLGPGPLVEAAAEAWAIHVLDQLDLDDPRVPY